MEPDRRARISKLLSYALRHAPASLGIALDGSGWTDVARLLAGLVTAGEPISRADLEEVVRTSDKQRFAFSADGGRIRASQGHSVPVDLALPPRAPPPRLYHGTAVQALVSIRASGLLRRSRTYVHLSIDVATALAVGARRKRPTVILTVRADALHRDGHLFFMSDNGVWLTERVPAAYLDYPSP